MRKIFVVVIILMTFIPVFTLGEDNNTQESIGAFVTKWQYAFNKKDLDLIISFYSKEKFKDWDVFRKSYQEMFNLEYTYKIDNLTIETNDKKDLKETITLNFRLSIFKNINEPIVNVGTFKTNLVLENINNNWLIVDLIAYELYDGIEYKIYPSE